MQAVNVNDPKAAARERFTERLRNGEVYEELIIAEKAIGMNCEVVE